MADLFITGLDGVKRGPFSEQKLQEMLAQGVIGPNALVGTETGVSVPLSDLFRSMDSPGQAQTAQSEFGIPDIGFAHFVTPILVTVNWWITVAVTIILCFALAALGGEQNGPAGFIVGAIIAIPFLLSYRMYLESIAIMFRMERHQRTIKEILERGEKVSESQKTA